MTASTGWGSIGRRLVPLACGVVLGSLMSVDAWAQASLMPNAPAGVGNIATGRRNGPAGAPEKPGLPPPSAIPGAKAREPVVPATQTAADMAPNDAMFDAINRGDIATVRDALGRGADLNAVNILGMTPMELSIDLGRNDISFLLLSMRGEDSGRGARAVGRETPATLAAAKPAAAKPSVLARRTAAHKPVPVPVAIKPMATAKLFANDGGTPQPNAGFLGFDSRSASN